MHRPKKFTFAIAALMTTIICFRPVPVIKADTSTQGDASSSMPVMYLRVTAYASVPDETDDTPFITASGETVRDGIVASNLLPFGTKIQIPSLFGNKIFTVEDRTSPRFAKTVDIWMPSKQKAIIFGANYATIIVLGTSTATSVAPTVATNLNIP
jgi:3D (Asp-Asp-Asp) domain-containing protein